MYMYEYIVNDRVCVCVCVSVNQKSPLPADHFIVLLYSEIIMKITIDRMLTDSPTADYISVVMFHCSVFFAPENIYRKTTVLSNVESHIEIYFCFSCCFTSSLHLIILSASNKYSITYPLLGC